jgi:hypothetical protein
MPGLGNEFVLKELSAISIVFLEDAKGNVIGANFNQPGAVYFLKKTK